MKKNLIALIKKAKFLMLVLFALYSGGIAAQFGILSGTGMSQCATFSFGICANQLLTPSAYGFLPYACLPPASPAQEWVSFTAAAPNFKVRKTTWSFLAKLCGRITGFDGSGNPITPIPFVAGNVIKPLSYSGTLVQLGINNVPVGPLLNQYNFAITLTCTPLSANSYTKCLGSPPISISVIPNTTAPLTYVWQPGGLTGNPVNVNPGVTTNYMVTATTGTCVTNIVVPVTVSNCAVPTPTGCCIGNPCVPGNNLGPNPLTGNWQVPLANNNYIFQNTNGSPNGQVGIGIFANCNPGNLLHLRRGIVNNVSGLRLSDFVGAPPQIPQANYLSVDGNGDVILAAAQPSGCCIGNICNFPAPPTNPLPNNWEISLQNYNYVFTKNAAGTGNVGIGDMLIPCMPQNLLEISRSSSGTGNVSGLRLSDLRSPAVPQPANGQVLSVDPANGDVILTSLSGSSSGFGANCPAPPATGLSAQHELPLNNFAFHFTTPSGSTKGQVIIGRLPASCVPQNARLNVYDDVLGKSIYGECSLPFGGTNIGVHGFATSAGGGASLGSLGEIQPTAATSYGAGVAGTVGAINLSSMPTRPVGVFGSWGSSGLGLYAGYFDGDVYTTGLYLPSDKSFKKDIKQLESVSEKLKNLHGYSYNYRIGEIEGKNFPKSEQIGLIAEEIKEVFPQLVKEDGKGYLVVNYQGMVPVLLEGLKEQQKQIDELKAMVQAMASNGTDNKQTNSQAVDLSDKNTIVLNQNVPNPFAESTTINYNIPTDFSKAQIIFSTSDGKVIKTVDVTTKGLGKLNVFSNDLSSGMYTYTLVVDGKTIDNKKMVRQ